MCIDVNGRKMTTCICDRQMYDNMVMVFLDHTKSLCPICDRPEEEHEEVIQCPRKEARIKEVKK